MEKFTAINGGVKTVVQQEQGKGSGKRLSPCRQSPGVYSCHTAAWR